MANQFELPSMAENIPQRHVNCDKCNFGTKQRMFKVLAMRAKALSMTTVAAAVLKCYNPISQSRLDPNILLKWDLLLQVLLSAIEINRFCKRSKN